MTDRYIDLGDRLPEYECSACGWLHGEGEAWGIGWETDRQTCPKCSVLITHSKKVREPDHSKSFTGFKSRVSRL